MDQQMKLLQTIFVLALMLGAQNSMAFCGFYVAKADATLFNKKSQVILVRDGYRSVITMSNDFKGDVRDFAMVVPVPVVLEREDIRIVSNQLFSTLDAYSAPRLAEYYDESPCFARKHLEFDANAIEDKESMPVPSSTQRSARDKRVTIEARYDVGEYDILILSAEESDGLKSWLVDNGYKIPEGAGKVLDPYIKNGLKFFVVKVDLDQMGQRANSYLRPLQIAFKSERFMLPIRLGMANSTGEQDMIVYAFTRQGRVECTNYRTVQIPTDRNIPSTIKNGKFGPFYRDLFGRAYQREGKNAVFLEYAWDVSPRNPVKCDPCVSQAPTLPGLLEAGVDWVHGNGNQVFFTRMHVRYSRDKFPQDLLFQVTPNKQRFQGRYVLHHPASEGFSCDKGQVYLEELGNRRKVEVDELASLTGWDVSNYRSYVKEYDRYIRPESPKQKKHKGETPVVAPTTEKPNGSDGMLILMLGFVTLLLVALAHSLMVLRNPTRSRAVRL